MSHHSVFLSDIPKEMAWVRFRQALAAIGRNSALPAERINLQEASGRVTADPIWARRSSPHYHACAMDGYALRSKDTHNVSDRRPKLLELGKECVYVDTGDALPENFDAVLPVEVIEKVDDVRIRIFQAVPPWLNVRPMGEDIVATELILPAGHQVRPIDLGAIAAAGHSSIMVVRRPRVAIIPTGDELVELGSGAEPRAGDIPEFNSLVLAAQVESWGALATRMPIVPDNVDALVAAMAEAAGEHDLILVNAGSSAGSEDFTASAVEKMGQLLVHGVAVRPGHPVIIGMLELQSGVSDDQHQRSIPIIGVPGYPVSAALTADIFVQPLLRTWLGQGPELPPMLEATLTRKIHSTPGDEEHVRVTLGKVDGRWVAAPLSRGAGVITSLVRADGILVVPSGTQGLPAGDQVAVRCLRSLEVLEYSILALGSHDLTLDLLAQFLAGHGRRLSSNNIGSIGGLVALGRGEAHLAGAHLLDPSSGSYNLAYVRQYLPGTPTTLLGLVMREQGLIVREDNPKGITSISDIQNEDIVFVNRQKGSGTRLLFDHHLELLKISPGLIEGYQHEEFTHLTVAAAVASGKADCGLGIRAAAVALGLGFIPVESERYDLVIPTAFLEMPLMTPLVEMLYDVRFRQAVEKLDGYDASIMGDRVTVED